MKFHENNIETMEGERKYGEIHQIKAVLICNSVEKTSEFKI